jgi:hypothetical protein
LLSFAGGAIPVRIEADLAAGVAIEQAIGAIDGANGVFVLTRPLPATTTVVLVYELPSFTGQAARRQAFR